jgi:hypothetical protein
MKNNASNFKTRQHTAALISYKFFFFNQQSEYKVFYKLMFWLEV